MCDARRYRSLFPRRRVAPPTLPPPSPPLSDEEPSVETYDPATELVGDPDEPYVAEHVPYGALEAYYSGASCGSERENASTDTVPSSYHSSGSFSDSVSLGYGSAFSGSASDGASDDGLIVRCWWFTQRMATSRLSEVRARTNNDLPAHSVTPTELIPQVSHREVTLIHGECYILREKLSVLYDSGATHSFLSNRVVSRVGLIPELLGFSLVVHTPASQSACAQRVYRNVVIDIMALVALHGLTGIPTIAIKCYLNSVEVSGPNARNPYGISNFHRQVHRIVSSNKSNRDVAHRIEKLAIKENLNSNHGSVLGMDRAPIPVLGLTL
ncbi:hypothetical protein PIB30_086332 [Stylosanthes scabra]|uniref:Polyprotein n=1 Tax=Stylosanthes scabra TaxID=79078 RepID=A0ABU6STM9_9FABA|nr:hypothetical protein [Stylosanthes scabra]